MAGLDKALYNFIRRRQIVGLDGGIVHADSQGILSAGDVGKTWYVAGNYGADTNDGTSWKKAFLTVAKAIAVNNAAVAADKYGWATRNRIYISGDTFDETLVSFPSKCDMIGVGSYNANSKPGITGNHAPVNTSNYATRFINIWFQAEAVASPLIDLVSSTSGLQLIDCTLDGEVGTVTHAIRNTASSMMQVVNCDIMGGFATGYIEFGAGALVSCLIADNWMHGSSGLGISTTITTTTAAYQALVRNNTISQVTTGLCIDDNADILFLVNNRFINAATLTNYAGYTGILDVNIARCVDNICMGADVSMRVPRVVVA